jgi:cellulose synthase operon protein YhjQ
LAVFSLAGGVGKTGIVATLGSALVARGENLLLVDTNSYGLLPLYYGVRDIRHGAVRTFSSGESEAAVQLLSLQPDSGAPAARWKDRAVLADKDSSPIADEVIEGSRHADRVIVDLATASVALVRQILSLTPRVLVPLLPDVASLAGVQAVESFFSRMSQAEGRLVEPVYILNSFDASLPLHVEMRATLQATLGNRLLSFVLRRTPTVAAALAEGMTVIEFAPDQPIAEDYALLASWIHNLSTPAGGAFRPKRWNDLSLD